MTAPPINPVTAAIARVVALSPRQRKQFLRQLKDLGIIGRRPRGERKRLRNDAICSQRAQSKRIVAIARDEAMSPEAVRMVLYRRRNAGRTFRLPAA